MEDMGVRHHGVGVVLMLLWRGAPSWRTRRASRRTTPRPGEHLLVRVARQGEQLLVRENDTSSPPCTSCPRHCRPPPRSLPDHTRLRRPPPPGTPPPCRAARCGCHLLDATDRKKPPKPAPPRGSHRAHAVLLLLLASESGAARREI